MIKVAEKQICPVCGRPEIGKGLTEANCGLHYWKQSYGETFVFFPKSGNWINTARLIVEPAPTASEYAWW